VDRRGFLKWGAIVAGSFLVGCHARGSNVVSNKTYYVDSKDGDDKKDGLSQDTAWKTLDRINGHRFLPGDSILLKTGSQFDGQLSLRGSGTNGAPIMLDKYGEGSLPRIDAGGKYKEALLLRNQEYWEISNLELTNTGETVSNYRYGVRISAWNAGVIHHIHLKNLYIHDVNGDIYKEDQAEGHGILWENGGRVDTCFDDLLIEGCHLERTDRTGIGGYSPYRHRTKRWYPSRHVVIRNNLLEDIGGDGIKVRGCDGALVEHNIVRNASQRNDGYSCGIWPFASDHTIIQYNEVSGMKGTIDGYAFDADFDTRGSIFQYNYSHDNEGGFMFLFTPRETEDCANTIVRYNISQNDGTRIFSIIGPVVNAQIYNNTVFIGQDLDVQVVLFSPVEGRGDLLWPDTISIQNNIFYADGVGQYVYNTGPVNSDGTYNGATGFGLVTNIDFDHNMLFGNHIYSFPMRNNRMADPSLVLPGNGKDGRSSLDGYKLEQESPCIGTGAPIDDNGGLDFWGNPVPQEKNPDIGAYQTQK